MIRRILRVAAVACLLVPAAASFAAEPSVLTSRVPTREVSLLVAAPADETPAATPLAALDLAPLALAEDTPVPAEAEPLPRAVSVSDAYSTRLTIHRIASYATVPLFLAEYFTGQHLYNQTSTGREQSGFAKSVHGPVAASIEGLFVVNTITGGWNALDEIKNHQMTTKHAIHAALMFASTAGFAATAALAPDSEGGTANSSDKSRHRTVALSSVAASLVGYGLMLFWKD